MIKIKATRTKDGSYLVETRIPGAPKEVLTHICPNWELTCVYIEGYMEMTPEVVLLEAEIRVEGERKG